MTYHMWIVLFIVLAIVGAGVVVWRWLTAPDITTDKFHDEYIRREAEVKALPIEEARRQVEMLLRDPKKFETVPSSKSPDNILDLAPGLQELFQNFARVHPVNSLIYLNREKIAPYRWDWPEGPWQEARFWRIGIWNGMSRAEILVKPNSEAIHVFLRVDAA